MADDILRAFGELDVLPLYTAASSFLGSFLLDREIASRVWLEHRILLNRGSLLAPLRADELAIVKQDPLKLRAKATLKEARESLTPLEQKIWRYFPPRKLCDYFYATNYEGQGKEIDRIFYDIDRPADMPHVKAREVTQLLLEAIEIDDAIHQIMRDQPFVAWTGSSFHVYLFLRQTQKRDFYTEQIQFTEKDPGKGLTAKWIRYVRDKTKVRVIGGHEKKLEFITIDPSQTPSGKLASSPVGSLHMKDYRTVDGISLPIENDRLTDPHLTDELREYSPNRVFAELSQLSKLLNGETGTNK